MEQTIQQSIISTLAYFDVFDYPLTAEELYRWMHVSDDASREGIAALRFEEIHPIVETLLQQSRIGCRFGFYCLPGREATVITRNLAVPLIEEKLRIARRAVRLIRYLPFVYGVYVCNTLASGTVKDESDIDVFIIIQKGRMWTTRLMITVLLSLFRLRRTDRCVANRICLSYYITRDRLNLQDVVIDNRDIYTWYWIDQVVPVYDRERVFQDFQEENQWVRHKVPRALQPVRLSDRYRVGDTAMSRFVRSAGEWFFGGTLGRWCERILRRWQRVFMERHEKMGMRPFPTSVVVSDRMLKFHENDRRGIFRAAWEKRVEQVSS